MISYFPERFAELEAGIFHMCTFTLIHKVTFGNICSMILIHILSLSLYVCTYIFVVHHTHIYGIHIYLYNTCTH